MFHNNFLNTLGNTKAYVLRFFYISKINGKTSHDGRFPLNKHNIKKGNNILIQAATSHQSKLQGKFHSILTCLCVGKHLTLRHRGNTNGMDMLQKLIHKVTCGKIQLPFRQYVLLSPTIRFTSN
jgi:hypothetical protein